MLIEHDDITDQWNNLGSITNLPPENKLQETQDTCIQCLTSIVNPRAMVKESGLVRYGTLIRTMLTWKLFALVSSSCEFVSAFIWR